MNRVAAILAVLVLLILPACEKSGEYDGRPAPEDGSAGQGALADIRPVPEEGEEAKKDEESRVLVACFSATGNTERVARHIQAVLDADFYAITPETPYTSEDLDYSRDDCRAGLEKNDPDARPEVAGVLENPEDYDVVFLGYPIWWGQAPKILYTFLESCRFDGAAIVPFCTSGSSGIGSSAEGLQALAPDADWLPGQRFSGSASRETVEAWVEGLNLPGLLASGDVQTRIRLTFDGGEAILEMEDNAAVRDFFSMLPASLVFEDYAGAEKISYPPRELSAEGASRGCDPQAGDVALYVPWGNLAVFYQDAGSSSDLVPMGRVVSGLELLAGMDGEFEAFAEIVE